MIHSATAALGPTKENALDAEKELAEAMRTNDADGVCRLLDRDWVVVDGNGGLNDRKSVCTAIKAGTFTRTTYEPDLANARVRVYGNIATITFHLSLSGPFKHKTFSGKEVETDILQWKDGGWEDQPKDRYYAEPIFVRMDDGNLVYVPGRWTTFPQK